MNTPNRECNECPECQRAFLFIPSGGPCSVCQRCCDCCLCGQEEFANDIESSFIGQLIKEIPSEETFLRCLKGNNPDVIDTEQFRRNMVKIAIWPHTMSDDEIIFDPETGLLTDEVIQKVKRYLSLNTRKTLSAKDASATPKQADSE